MKKIIEAKRRKLKTKKEEIIKMTTDPKETKSTLQKLKDQRAKLDARIQAAEARTRTSERKKETQRKILVGAYYLDQARKNNQMDKIKKVMDGYLKRTSDRMLFDLPDKGEAKN